METGPPHGSLVTHTKRFEKGLCMVLIRRMAFWFSMFSITICFKDYWETIHASTILLIGLGPFEPFKHWLLDFDPFKPPNSADISAKIPGYLVHFAFFFLIGTIIDCVVRFLGRTRRSRT
jgi:hypothetical protein